jgi:hypothetical protein
MSKLTRTERHTMRTEFIEFVCLMALLIFILWI